MAEIAAVDMAAELAETEVADDRLVVRKADCTAVEVLALAVPVDDSVGNHKTAVLLLSGWSMNKIAVEVAWTVEQDVNLPRRC